MVITSAVDTAKGVSTPQDSPSGEAVLQELQKILTSQAFRSVGRQRDFLRYAVEQTLAGHGDLLKEYSLGIEVFQKPDSFDPRIDPIVRIQAGKLRSRMAKYYEHEGKQDPVRIEFQRGSYTPIFNLALPETVAPPEKAPPAEPIEVVPNPAPAWRKRTVAYLLSLLCAGGGIFGLAWFRPHGSAPLSPPSIAVLPFTNLDHFQEDEYFSDGLTEELIDSLGRVPGLQVVARTSAFQFKGKATDIREIGRKLNVRNVLEGSLQRYDGGVRIHAQLADAVTGYRVWSASYDRDLKDGLAIQREISQAIVSALGVELAGGGSGNGPQEFLHATAAVNPEAHENYLKGLYFWNRITGADLATSISYFKKAIALQPDYSLAYAALSRTYISTATYSNAPTREVAPKIRAAALKALELDSTLGEPHMHLGTTYGYNYQWPEAEREFKRGIELEAGNAVAHRMYSNGYLVVVGRLEESLAELNRSAQLDPVSPYGTQAIAKTLYYLRRYDDAIDEFGRALVLEPNFGLTHRGLGLAYVQKGMFPQAVAELESARRQLGNDSWTTSLLGYVYARAGRTDQARQILNTLLEQSHRGQLHAGPLAQVYLGLGDKDRAFECLRDAIEQREGANLYLIADPMYDPLRPDPRFADLLHRMNLR